MALHLKSGPSPRWACTGRASNKALASGYNALGLSRSPRVLFVAASGSPTAAATSPNKLTVTDFKVTTRDVQGPSSLHRCSQHTCCARACEPDDNCYK
jgi:hypothetical protein